MNLDILEYRRRYAARMVECGVLPGVAGDAADGVEGDTNGDYSDPEGDADEEMSYWDADE